MMTYGWSNQIFTFSKKISSIIVKSIKNYFSWVFLKNGKYLYNIFSLKLIIDIYYWVDDMKTAILVPCYNEAATIEKVVSDFKKVMPHADIYVYDNNSTDGTDQIARNAGAIVRYEYKQGKGNVVRSMFRDIDADCYIIQIDIINVDCFISLFMENALLFTLFGLLFKLIALVFSQIK